MRNVIRVRKRHVIEHRLVHVDRVCEGEELGFRGEGDLENGFCDGDRFGDGFRVFFLVDVEEGRDGEGVDGLAGDGVFSVYDGSGTAVDGDEGESG